MTAIGWEGSVRGTETNGEALVHVVRQPALTREIPDAGAVAAKEDEPLVALVRHDPPATRVLVAGSWRSGQDWEGFGVETTTGRGWSAGLDWKDEELPWGARFGVRQEWNPGALEEKSGLREGFAHSADDRALLTVRVGF